MAFDERIQRAGKDRRIYTWLAIILPIIVLLGFARTYYLKGVFAGPPLPGLVHLHGLVMTLWVVFFIVQVRLVATRRTNVHRRLGVLGSVLAGLVLIVGVITSISAAARGAAPPGAPPLQFLVVPLFDMLLFGILIGTALYLRNRMEIHKRLMFVAAVILLGPAIARIPLKFIETGGALAFFGLTDLILVAFVAYDTIRNRRLHPAFLWSVVFVIASQPLRLMLAGTEVWSQFASWLVRFV